MRMDVKAWIGFVLAAFWAVAAGAQTSATDSASARAQIVVGIALQNTAPLNFGDIATSAAAGSVTVSPAGVATGAGGATVLNNPANPASAASYNVLLIGNPGNKKFWIQLPANGTVTISNGFASMPLNNFTANLPCAQTSATPPGPGGCASAPNTLTVGATLSVGANQPVGSYSGTFSVTVHRF